MQNLHYNLFNWKFKIYSTGEQSLIYNFWEKDLKPFSETMKTFLISWKQHSLDGALQICLYFDLKLFNELFLRNYKVNRTQTAHQCCTEYPFLFF